MSRHEPIVVGLHHTPASAAALRWAVEQARAQECHVNAVHAFELVDRPGRVWERDLPGARHESRIRAQNMVIASLGDHEEDDPRVQVSTCDGSVVAVLASAAHGAAMVVVGTPCPGDDVVDRLVRTVTCPVIEVAEDGTSADARSQRSLVGA